MNEILVLSLLIEEYKLENNCEDLPEDFNTLRDDEQIKILNKALEEHKKIEEIINK